MPGVIDLADVPADIRAKLNLKQKRERKAMTKDALRKYAIRVLNTVADLPQSERERVLEHALKMSKL